jgi:hypothetical protein
MATKQQIERHIADKLRVIDEDQKLTGAQVEAAVLDTIGPSDWNSIANWIKSNNFSAIGQHIDGLVKAEISVSADQEAAAMLVDDVLTLDEYARTEDLP